MRGKKIKLITSYPSGTKMETKEVEVFAAQNSVKRSEFYAAYAAGLKPELTLDVVPSEYALADVQVGTKLYHAKRVLVDGVEYDVLRTFAKSRHTMELVVG